TGVLLLVTARCGRLLRRFPQCRFILVLRVLRTGDCAEVFSHRHLWFDQQGVRRDEAYALFVLRWHVGFCGNHRRLCDDRLVGSDSTDAIPFQPGASVMGISRVVSGVCCASRHLAVAYMVANGACRGTYRRINVARRYCNETWRLRRLTRGDESISGGIPNMEQMDRTACCDRNCLRSGGRFAPTRPEVRHRLFKRESHGFRTAR